MTVLYDKELHITSIGLVGISRVAAKEIYLSGVKGVFKGELKVYNYLDALGDGYIARRAIS